MTKTGLLSAAAVVAAMIATPALAQHARHQHGAYAHQPHGWANRHHSRSGFWPGAVAAGVVGGAIGTAAAIGSAPYRDGPYAYYGSGPQYGDSYAYYGPRRGMTTCGVEPYATYMGPDGRWYPC